MASLSEIGAWITENEQLLSGLAAIASAPGEPVVAVLAFENLSSDPETRNDVRFPPLCARLGLVELWTATGRWPDCADEVPYDFREECERVRGVPKEAFGSSTRRSESA